MENLNIVNDIKKIVEENRVQLLTVGERTFATKDMHEIRPIKNTADRLNFSDLSSIVEIVKKEHSRFVCPLYINIETEKRVSVTSSLDDEKERETPYRAEADGSKFYFSEPYDYEKFVIAIRSLFVQSDNSARLLELLKKVAKVDSLEMSDDGISQKVVAQSGASLAESVKVSPIVKLSPFRTFLEVEQPESEFLFRISNGNKFALYEADGGAWKIKAKKNIRTFFEKALKKEIDEGKIIILG